jgi:hypothetical protein
MTTPNAPAAESATSSIGFAVNGRSEKESPASVAGVQAKALPLPGWMPIETAPKDGTRVLLGYERSHSEEGYWMGESSSNYWSETGWFASDEDPLTTHPSKPSHWMPLPAAPGATALPPGYRLVPIEPTAEMLKAMMGFDGAWCEPFEDERLGEDVIPGMSQEDCDQINAEGIAAYADCYRAMLSAVPATPPASDSATQENSDAK